MYSPIYSALLVEFKQFKSEQCISLVQQEEEEEKTNCAPMKKTHGWIAILLFSGGSDFASLPAFERRQRSLVATSSIRSSINTAFETHQINDVHVSRRTMCLGRRPSAVAFQYLNAFFQFADKQRKILLTGREQFHDSFMWKYRNINLIFFSHSLSLAMWSKIVNWAIGMLRIGRNVWMQRGGNFTAALVVEWMATQKIEYVLKILCENVQQENRQQISYCQSAMALG